MAAVARIALAVAAVTLAALAHAAGASAPVDKAPTWASLSPAQKSVLAPLQADWAGIEADRKQKWLEVARRFPSLPEAERQRIQQRMVEWARMSPSERGRARLQFQETRQISPADRQARWEAYKSLPDEQRRELAQRARPAPESRTAEAAGAKRNIVPSAHPGAVKPVAPTVVQAKPGVSTSLMSASAPGPTPHQPGLPKIAATRDYVNPQTLLPKRGPQGAAVQAAASSPSRPQP